MGARDWPQTSSSGPFEDEAQAGAKRYVLEGSGTVRALDEAVPVAVGTMVDVSEDCTLSWQPDEGCTELVLLTPEYKGPPLAAVAAGFGFLFIALIAATVTSQ